MTSLRTTPVLRNNVAPPQWRSGKRAICSYSLNRRVSGPVSTLQLESAKPGQTRSAKIPFTEARSFAPAPKQGKTPAVWRSRALSRSGEDGDSFPDAEQTGFQPTQLGEAVRDDESDTASWLVQGIKDRAEADPDFWFKLGSEIIIDQIISFITNVATLGPLGMWTPAMVAQAAMLHLTALFNDCALVWNLAPTGKQDAKEEDEKVAIAHCFQPGDFSASERLMCWVRKWWLYSRIGGVTALLSWLVICAVTQQGITLQTALNSFLMGALHLGISSNTRYQLINGFEVLFYKHLPKMAARAGTITIRATNQFVGARVVLFLASFIA